MEGDDRETRVQQRRQRIEARNAAKVDGNKEALENGELKKLGHGQKQVRESLYQLDKQKLASIQHVTSIRVAADDIENKHRIEEEQRRHDRIEKIQVETLDCRTKNAAVEMRWSDLFEYRMPQELHEALQAQNGYCNEILASKDALINEFQNQLKAKDETYVASLRSQSADVDELIQRMRQQYRHMQEIYEVELVNVEDAYLKERNELITKNKSEIDALFEKRRETEMIYMEAKQTRDEQYQKEIEDLRIRDLEDYNELKIKLEMNIQTLEQQLEEMRATYQLNTEKLEYNYRVLTERDMENSATLSQQKRKLGRLKDALSALIAKYNQADARDRNQNQTLTEEFRRLTNQYQELQLKFAHFETRDARIYEEVKNMHKEEVITMVDKLLDADRVIHDQQLGLKWQKPKRHISEYDENTIVEESASQITGQTINSDGNERSPSSSITSRNAIRASDTAGSQITDDANDIAYVEKISASKLKYLLRTLAKEAGFLVTNPNILAEIDALPDDEAELVKADMVMKSLGIDDVKDVERLLAKFFKNPRAKTPYELLQPTIKSNSSPNELQAERSTLPSEELLITQWGLKVSAEDFIPTIKEFVEENNKLKRGSPAHPGSNEPSAPFIEKSKNEYSSTNLVSCSFKASLQGKKSQDYNFWNIVTKVVPPRTIRVMQALEKGLSMHYAALQKRKTLIDEVSTLKQQNGELKSMLKQHLDSSINNDLIIPPTQMQVYQR